MAQDGAEAITNMLAKRIFYMTQLLTPEDHEHGLVAFLQEASFLAKLKVKSR